MKLKAHKLYSLGHEHPVDVYMKEDVDALLAEKDKEIAELKKKLMPCLNGDCILTCEVVEKYGKENAELKQKLEDVQASHYAEMVDAGMRERRLRKQLRHSNHKRCLAMAKYCEAMRGHYLSYEEPKWFWYRKWSKRWLALAEKFKTNNQTAQ